MSSQALIKFTEQKIGSNQQLQSFVQEARKVANVIFPETVSFSDQYAKLGVEIVTVNINNSKEVYKNESGGYCMHLSKLNEIAKAAKIRVTDSRILERKTDDSGKVTFISHQVKVSYRTVSGEMIEEVFTGKYDYFRDSDKFNSEKQIKQRRSHAEALAESNALYRAFNKVLPQLSTSFSAPELAKPFLVPFVEDDMNAMIADLPAEDQIQLKKELTRKRMGLTEGIYPSASPQTQKPRPASSDTTESNPGSDQYNADDAQVIEEQSAQIPPEEQAKITAEEFRNSPQDIRTKKILDLVKETNYNDPNSVAITESRIEKQSLDNQITFIIKLLLLNTEEVPL